MELYNETYFNRRNYILQHLDDLKIDAEEGLLLLVIDYLNEYNQNVDYYILSKKLKLNENRIDVLVNGLIEKGYLEIKIEKKVIHYALDGVFKMNSENKPIDMNIYKNLFDLYERGFGRPLSSNEAQRLSGFMKEYEFKLIEYALKEATVYEKINFNYIEKILINWKAKGLTPADYETGERGWTLNES